ncbi:ubiquitin-conjugating enzyme/RWD-like protein, partial [Terfezia claveryi]
MARANTPTIKRILREASELNSHPTPDIHAHPLSDSSLFEWHFTIRGPPPPSPFSTGIYHGRISLPPTYPLRPPSFRFLTPSGRFEVNREICLSISGHHEETWQPAWGIRTALVAIRAFMDSEVGGQVGGLECSVEGRRDLAGWSREWKCRECEGGLTNEEVLERERRRWEEMGGDGKKGERLGGREGNNIPKELRLAYREDLEG